MKVSARFLCAFLGGLCLVLSCSRANKQKGAFDRNSSEASVSDEIDSNIQITALMDDPGALGVLSVLNYSHIAGGTNYEVELVERADSTSIQIGAVQEPQILELMSLGANHRYNTRIFVTPADSMELQIENGQWRFTGENATHYNFFSELDSLTPNWPPFQGNIRRYKEEVQAVHNVRQQVFEDYLRKNEVSEEFSNLVGGELKFEYLYNLVAPRSGVTGNVEYYYNELGGLSEAIGASFGEKLLDLNAYFDGIQLEDLKRPELVNNDYFKRSLTAFVRFYFMEQDEVYYSRGALNKEKQFIENNFEGELETYLLGRMLYDYFQEGYAYGPKQSEHLLRIMDEYQENDVSPVSRDIINDLYEQTLAVKKVAEVAKDMSDDMLATN